MPPLVPLLLVAVPLCVEDWGRWLELAVSLAVVGVTFAFFGRFPVAVLSLSVAGVLVPTLVLADTATDPVRVWPFVACAVVAYLAGRRLSSPAPALAGFAATLAAGLLAAGLTDMADRGAFGLLFGLYDWFLAVLALLVVAALPWLVGRYRLQGTEMVAAGLERAAVLERTRIAREMHDSLGHEWGLVALRAAALEMSPRLDDDTRAQIGEVRAGVTAATERLREIVQLLGDPETDLAALVDRSRAAGQDVSFTSAPDLPPPAARVVHRIVREGLTNAARHAPGTLVTIQIDTGGRTTVTVENRLPDSEDKRGNGSGLAGLREEVSRLGGDLDARRGDGRFVLTATLPHEPPPARRSPSRVWRLVRVPLLATAVVMVLGGGLYFVAGSDNRLDPVVYQSLHIGQSQEDVEKVLPRFQILGDPERSLPAPPRHADCRHYWATVQTDDRLFYRLCFVDGRLAVRETVPR
jgi:signal transduction histidine kinase